MSIIMTNRSAEKKKAQLALELARLFLGTDASEKEVELKALSLHGLPFSVLRGGLENPLVKKRFGPPKNVT